MIFKEQNTYNFIVTSVPQTLFLKSISKGQKFLYKPEKFRRTRSLVKFTKVHWL